MTKNVKENLIIVGTMVGVVAFIVVLMPPIFYYIGKWWSLWANK